MLSWCKPVLFILTRRHDNSHETIVAAKLLFTFHLPVLSAYWRHKSVLLPCWLHISPPAQPNDRYGRMPSAQQIQKNRKRSPEARNVIAISEFTFASVHKRLSQQLSALISHSSQPFSFHVESEVKGLGNKILKTNCGGLTPPRLENNTWDVQVALSCFFFPLMSFF